MEDYSWVGDNSAQLILVQSVKDCSTTYEYSGDSGEDSGDTSNETDDHDHDHDHDDDDATRRRLADDEDEDDSESDDGISSDDSDEFDAGYTQYIANGQAVDKCDGQDPVNISSSLIYNTDDEELHYCFGHFDCTLYIDPLSRNFFIQLLNCNYNYLYI